MITGKGKYIIDVKKRMALPKAMRAEFGECVYVAPGFDRRTLTIFPVDQLEKIKNRVDQLPLSKSIPLGRRIFPNAEKTQIDTQGRILIPLELLDGAGMKIEDEVMVIGVGDFAEVWPINDYRALDEANKSTSLMSVLEEVDI